MGNCSSKKDTLLRNDVEYGIVIYNNPAFVQNNDKNNFLNIVTDSNTPLTKLFLEKSQFNESTFEITKQYLIDGANPNIPCITSDRKTLLSPLYLCCRHGYTPSAVMIAELLLKNGAEVEPQYTALTNYSPLMIVLRKNKTTTATFFCYKSL
jgi:hypothetical protein